MAWSNFVLNKGYDVAAGQQTTKFRFVKFSAAETVTPVAAITDVVCGVAQFGVSTAELARGKGEDVMLLGVSEVEAAGAIAVGNRVQLENNGRVSAEVGASGKRLVGLCVGTPATNAGDRCSVLILLGLGLA